MRHWPFLRSIRSRDPGGVLVGNATEEDILESLNESAGTTAYDSTVAEAMSDYWVAFATSGDPNGPPRAGEWPNWPRYSAATDALLEIGPEIATRTMVKRAVYDSLDAIARSRGQLRPR